MSSDLTDLTIRECSCGKFEILKDGRLIHVADSYKEAENAQRVVALEQAILESDQDAVILRRARELEGV